VRLLIFERLGDQTVRRTGSPSNAGSAKSCVAADNRRASGEAIAQAEVIANERSRAAKSDVRPLSEIQLVRDRDVIVEQMLVIFGTDVFGHLLLHAPVSPLARPGLIERIRVVDR
jgi:hypothetical protein